jgi:hypothetical protein
VAGCHPVVRRRAGTPAQERPYIIASEDCTLHTSKLSAQDRDKLAEWMVAFCGDRGQVINVIEGDGEKKRKTLEDYFSRKLIALLCCTMFCTRTLFIDRMTLSPCRTRCMFLFTSYFVLAVILGQNFVLASFGGAGKFKVMEIDVLILSQPRICIAHLF